MKVVYEKVIVVGSGKFPYECAAIIHDKYSQVQVWEYKASELSILKSMCVNNNIEYYSYDSEEMRQNLNAILGYKVLIISAFNIYLFPKEVVQSENVDIVNYHNAYLPYHPGRNAEAWCIYNGDKMSGVTWHYVDDGIDTGDILLQERINLTEDITSLELLKMQNEKALQLFERLIDDLLYKGKMTGTKQIESREDIHYSKAIPNDGWFNLNWDISDMYKFLRAMNYGKMCILGPSKIKYEGVEYIIKKYKLEPDKDNQAGKKVYKADNLLCISEDNQKLTLFLK